MPDYVVVLGAESGARFKDEAYPMVIRDFATELGPVSIIFRTRWSLEGYTSPVPREMWLDVRGSTNAPFNEAVSVFAAAANALLPVVAVGANASVSDAEVKIAFDNSPASTEREFFQSFVRENRGMPLPGRWIDVPATIAVIDAFSGHRNFSRLHRAAEQYRVALGHWRPGHEVMALAHLYMAMEALTVVARRREADQRSTASNDELAEAFGVDKAELDGHIRRTILFQRDAETCAAAKEASDAFEHGFLPLPDIHSLAEKSRDLTAKYVREGILALAGVTEDARERLLQSPYDEPLHQWVVKYLRGTFVGESDDLALPDQEYPGFVWTSGLKEFKELEDGSFEVTPEETMTARFTEKVRFERRSLEYWGSTGRPTPTEIPRTAGEVERSEEPQSSPGP